MMIKRTCSFFLFVILFIFLISSNEDTGKNTALIKFSIGKAELLPARQTDWQQLRVNMPVKKGDRLRTALKSRIELQMPDGSVIKIRENTIFDVKEIKTQEEDKEDQMGFTIWAGNIWASFKKTVSSRQIREIESPSAVVAIRGTTLEIGVNQNQSTTVGVSEGQVLVKSKDTGGEVLVGVNQQTFVEKGKSPTSPTAFAPGALEEDEGSLPSGLNLEINTSQLQFTDPAVLTSGIPVSGRISPGSTLTANGVPLNVLPNGTFSGRVMVQEGLNTILFAGENKGLNDRKEMRVFANTKSPEIQISRPVTSKFLNRRDYSLSGAVFDATPMDKVKVTINGEMITETAGGRGSFNRTIILNEGKNTIHISAVDRSGNTAELTEQILLDTVKPIITVTEPPVGENRDDLGSIRPPAPPGDTRSYYEKVVRGIVIDPEPSSGLKTIAIDGQELKPKSDGSFETVVRINRGEKRQINIVAEDLAGNISRESSRSVYIP